MRVPGLVCDKLDIDILIHIYKNDINNHKIESRIYFQKQGYVKFSGIFKVRYFLD
jgi:hypothetical protein